MKSPKAFLERARRREGGQDRAVIFLILKKPGSHDLSDPLCRPFSGTQNIHRLCPERFRCQKCGYMHMGVNYIHSLDFGSRDVHVDGLGPK